MTSRPETARIFRAALAADAPTIRSLLLESHLSAPSAGDLERVTDSRVGEILTFVCEREGRVVGVLGWRNLGEEAEILDLAVHGSHRHQGHASFLLANFLDGAARSAVRGIFLEVRESNRAAIALYRKFGFQISGRRPNYYRNPEENALLMHLALRASTKIPSVLS
jgi:ribosomal-protein-alanine acetyltransferase